MKMTVTKAPWIAISPATAFPTGSRAAASQPQSKALRAFSCKGVSRKLMGSALRMTAKGSGSQRARAFQHLANMVWRGRDSILAGSGLGRLSRLVGFCRFLSRPIGRILGEALAVRCGSSRVVRDIPTGTLELDGWRRQQSLQVPPTAVARGQRSIGELLDFLDASSTLFALVFVKRQAHLPLRVIPTKIIAVLEHSVKRPGCLGCLKGGGV